MIRLLKALFRDVRADAGSASEPAGMPAFPFDLPVAWVNGFPFPDWEEAAGRLDDLPDGDGAAAWEQCERAWLELMRQALGPGHVVKEQGTAMLLSSLDAKQAKATLAFMNRTLRRIPHLLEGLAQVPAWGRDILVVFDDAESYYRYVAVHYPEAGDFGLSSGMFIGSGCAHFVTIRESLTALEPVIVHEMTHAFLAHLPLPPWLNEGLAVNMEEHLAPPPLPSERPTPDAHAAFWTRETIQEFWSGAAFRRPDAGQRLSYDLARLLVSRMGEDWPSFRDFARDAAWTDAGAAAAERHLGLDLGAAACNLLRTGTEAGWSPDPASWS